MENRVNYLELAKEKAIAELSNNGVASAYLYLWTALNGHPDTADSVMLKIFKNLFVSGRIASERKMKIFIKGLYWRKKEIDNPLNS